MTHRSTYRTFTNNVGATVAQRLGQHILAAQDSDRRWCLSMLDTVRNLETALIITSEEADGLSRALVQKAAKARS